MGFGAGEMFGNYKLLEHFTVMKALQIILNCFVLIVISAPFISKTLFKRQALGYFWELEPNACYLKKKKKFKITKNFGMLHF